MFFGLQLHSPLHLCMLKCFSRLVHAVFIFLKSSFLELFSELEAQAAATSNSVSSCSESESENDFESNNVPVVFCDEINLDVVYINSDKYKESVKRRKKPPPLSPPSPLLPQLSPLSPPPRASRSHKDKSATTNKSNAKYNDEKSYEQPDEYTNNIPDFTPHRHPGSHVNMQQCTRSSFTKALDFFQLYFTDDIIDSIVKHTNAYAWINIANKQSYSGNDGDWKETDANEMKKLLALLIYQGLVKASTFNRYWSTKSLYHGLWARRFMSRNRYTSLLAMLHVVDPTTEDHNKKLKKVDTFIDNFREKCKKLFQPFQNVAIDERLVKSKHRSGIRQYIANKPAKFGLKLWVLADSKTGYTYDFIVYTGKTNEVYLHGLGYHVVMKLLEPLLTQGYHAFFDNFYTSVRLLNDLYLLGTPACGTVTENRKGFPVSLKNGKQWAKKKVRGEMRWVREGNCLALQWIDNKTVTMLSTIDTANEYVEVERKVKVNQKWGKVVVKKPFVVERYNAYMNGVDKSDQKLAKYNLLHKCVKWWKTLLFHMIDIACVNGFVLFQQHRENNPDNINLKRPSKYSILEFREELVRSIVDMDEYADPPLYRPHKDTSTFTSEHTLEFSDKKRNCKVCYSKYKKELHVYTYCSAPQCNVHLHFTKEKNCCREWHSTEYHRKFDK